MRVCVELIPKPVILPLILTAPLVKTLLLLKFAVSEYVVLEILKTVFE
jgi:hypothetical protein